MNQHRVSVVLEAEGVTGAKDTAEMAEDLAVELEFSRRGATLYEAKGEVI